MALELPQKTGLVIPWALVLRHRPQLPLGLDFPHQLLRQLLRQL